MRQNYAFMPYHECLHSAKTTVSNAYFCNGAVAVLSPALFCDHTSLFRNPYGSDLEKAARLRNFLKFSLSLALWLSSEEQVSQWKRNRHSCCRKSSTKKLFFSPRHSTVSFTLFLHDDAHGHPIVSWHTNTTKSAERRVETYKRSPTASKRHSPNRCPTSPSPYNGNCRVTWKERSFFLDGRP